MDSQACADISVGAWNATNPDAHMIISSQPSHSGLLDPEVLGRAVSGLAKDLIPGLIAHAKEMGVPLPPGVDDPNDLPPAAVVQLLRDVCLHYFPALAGR